MKSEELERFKELGEYWREPHVGTGDTVYDNGVETGYMLCADALERVLQSFNKDEETE